MSHPNPYPKADYGRNINFPAVLIIGAAIFWYVRLILLSTLYIYTLPAQVYPVHNALCTLTDPIAFNAGLCIAIDLINAGQQRNFVIVEKGNQVGGTWNDNSYPGYYCDGESLWLLHGYPHSWVRWLSAPAAAFADHVPVLSHHYSFSFEPDPKWSREYPG